MKAKVKVLNRFIDLHANYKLRYAGEEYSCDPERAKDLEKSGFAKVLEMPKPKEDKQLKPKTDKKTKTRKSKK